LTGKQPAVSNLLAAFRSPPFSISEQCPMADAVALSPEPEAKKKGLAGRLLMPLLLLVVGASAGAAGAFFLPTLMPQAGEAQHRPTPKVEIGPLEYVEIDHSFTANLKDTGRFVQVRIAISTNGGQPVVEAIERHEPAIIATVLGALAETTEADISAPGGREALTRRMRLAINDLLQRKSGLAGVDDVFLTSFIVQ
jgi:flagellar basal body-associated protein FliL